MNLDLTELIKRIIKYLIEGLMVGLVTWVVGNTKNGLKIEEILLIGLTAAATFAILDTFLPSMGETARSGAGFGLGASLVGWPGGL
jgi:ABC-type Co2+ transport system permease subunit